MRLRALGRMLTAVLGFAGAAWAESEPCACSVKNQRVVPADSCLVFDLDASCDASTVRNVCAESVLLVDWPLKDDLCRSTECSRVLQPGEQAAFYFTGIHGRGAFTAAEDSYVVREGTAENRTLTVSGDISCSPLLPEKGDEGCAAAPGALAALGVLLTVPLARRRR
ncbi:hypothetical protein JY651_40025 [Pyxidicoccus parkwayensis]|uniref:Lipoprotein n=1 Tax=Pyxidicoccus parkwayensis TaxID=2813578 RepID=A0ABX7NS88_9BACT|nr:MXAN_0125 family MYXO-CTERM protein [Pyxidicoccus parkwaysis]QSQ21313.1 hypothetical protein JY651_40025 [Pyxidicoccus parkwaysis]